VFYGKRNSRKNLFERDALVPQKAASDVKAPSAYCGAAAQAPSAGVEVMSQHWPEVQSPAVRQYCPTKVDVSPAAVALKQGIVVSVPVNSAALTLESSAMIANLEAICKSF